MADRIELSCAERVLAELRAGRDASWRMACKLVANGDLRPSSAAVALAFGLERHVIPFYESLSSAYGKALAKRARDAVNNIRGCSRVSYNGITLPLYGVDENIDTPASGGAVVGA